MSTRPRLGTRGEGEAAMLIIKAWRDPANKEICDAFGGDILLFDAYIRAAAAGHAKVCKQDNDPIQQRLDPIIASMRQIDY